MSPTDDANLHMLVARLSDHGLSAEEFRQLNDLLLSDSLSQDLYLDHLLMDGLLEQELAGANFRASPLAELSESTPDVGRLRSRIRPGWLQSRPAALVSWLAPSLLLVAALFAVPFWHVSRSLAVTRTPVNLVHSGFESGAVLSSVPGQGPAWYGDVADIVGESAGISPLEGQRMVRLVRSTSEPEHGCELYQIVNLGNVADSIASGSVSVEASAYFNAAQSKTTDKDTLFQVTVYACEDDPTLVPDSWPLRSENSMAFSGSHSVADDDQQTWQQVKTQLALPVETRYLILQISVMNAGDGDDINLSSGQFADNVAVTLIGN